MHKLLNVVLVAVIYQGVIIYAILHCKFKLGLSLAASVQEIKTPDRHWKTYH